MPNLPEMIFADNVLELYVPANTVQPLIQFNPYDALELVDPNTLPTFVVCFLTVTFIVFISGGIKRNMAKS